MPVAVGRTTTVAGATSGVDTSSTDISSGPCQTIPFKTSPLGSRRVTIIVRLAGPRMSGGGIGPALGPPSDVGRIAKRAPQVHDHRSGARFSSARHERDRAHRRARPALDLERERHKERERRQQAQVLQVLDDVDLVTEQRVMRWVVFRAGGVHGHRVAPDERDALTDKVLRGRPAETGPIFQKAPPIPTRPPSPVPPVADEDTVPGLQGTILRFPGPNAVRAEQVAGPEIRGLYSGGAAREAVQGDAVRAVAGWAFGDEVEGGVD